MLQSMRHLAQSWFFKGLMLILVISFTIWGIGDIFRGNPLQEKVAKVGDTPITVQELQQAFDEGLARARQMFGPDVTAQQARQMGMVDHVLDQLIERAAIDQEVGKLGIDLGDQALLDRIAQQPQFRDKDGKFNVALFRQLLQQQHINEARFLADGRQDMMRQQLLDLFNVDFTPPDVMVAELYKARGQKRIFDIVTLKNSGITTIASPDDKALHDYYQSNPQLFSAPEYRGLTIARLSTDDLAKNNPVSDDDLRKQYDKRSEELTKPERRDFVQVVVQDEARARQLAVDARASNNLTGAAKEKGYDAIPINQADAKSLPVELAKPVFALQAGQIADPVKTGLGWHVIQLSKITPAGKPDFDSVKKELRDTLQRDQAIETATRLVNQIDDQLAAGHALEDIADSLKLRVIKIPALDATGKTPDGKDPAELPNKDDVLKTAFGQNADETSPILDDKNGNYFVVRTDDITPAALKPFDKVKDAVKAAWKTAEQGKHAHEQAEKIAAGLRGGKSPDSFGDLGATSRVSKPVSLMGDNDADIPQTVLPQLLKLNKGEVNIQPLADRQLIIRLVGYQDAGAPDTAARAKLGDTLKTDMAKEWAEEYVKYLRTVFPVRIYQDTLESFRQQGS